MWHFSALFVSHTRETLSISSRLHFYLSDLNQEKICNREQITNWCEGKLMLFILLHRFLSVTCSSIIRDKSRWSRRETNSSLYWWLSWYLDRSSFETFLMVDIMISEIFPHKHREEALSLMICIRFQCTYIFSFLSSRLFQKVSARILIVDRYRHDDHRWNSSFKLIK